MIPDLTLATLIELAALALAFSRVERATFHEDGERPETDSDHVVMLGLIACELGDLYDLDTGRIAEFVLVHDLPEADPDCGDTQTLVISADERAAKVERERRAVERLDLKFSGRRMMKNLRAYEKQVEPEARLVRLVDKIVPKLTHALNGCEAAKRLKVTREAFEEAHRLQLEKLTAEYPEFPRVLELLADSMGFALECYSRPADLADPWTDWVSGPDGVGLVPCPTCGAAEGQQCSTREGEELGLRVHFSRASGT